MANEKRLIDANALKDGLSNLEASGGHKYYRQGMDAVLHKFMPSFIDEQTTVDAVEVVRCKDCKHRGDEGGCPMYWLDEIEWDDDGYTEYDYVPHDYTVDDGFCDRGERGTEE